MCIWVRNYRFHEQAPAPIKCRVEVEINGQTQKFEKIIAPHLEAGEPSDVEIIEFDYDPTGRPAEKSQDERYSRYGEDVILAQWRTVLPPAHILQIDDARGIVDVMLGVLALAGGTRDLDGYLADLKARGQADMRTDDIALCLAELGRDKGIAKAQTAGELPAFDDMPV